MIEQDGSRRHAGTRSLVVAALLGAVVGVAVTLLATPRSGREVRQRLARGMTTLQKAMGEVATEAGEIYSGIGCDLRQSTKQSLRRLREVWRRTRAAFLSEGSGERAGPTCRSVKPTHYRDRVTKGRER
ncbi:YtxH domain-containing protein [Candidatus Nitrospira bockiana]